MKHKEESKVVREDYLSNEFDHQMIEAELRQKSKGIYPCGYCGNPLHYDDVDEHMEEYHIDRVVE